METLGEGNGVKMEKEVVKQPQISEMNVQEIMTMLPHRAPFLMINKMKDVVPGESGIGIKNVTADEPYFQGHFPGNPIMPGVLQVEAMAQAAGVVVVATFPPEEREGVGVYFMTVDGVKFRKPVVPGDVLELHVKKEQAVRNVFKFKGEAFVNGKLVSQAVFSAMILKRK